MQKQTEIIVYDGYQQQNIEVLLQEEVQLDINVPLFYIKSGEEEIQAYVDNHAKPQLDEFTSAKKQELENKGEEIRQKAKSDIDDYVKTTTKPQIENFVEENIKPELEEGLTQVRSCVTQAQNLLEETQNSEEKAQNSANQAQQIVAAFDTHAEQKTQEFDQNAAQKQAQVDEKASQASNSAQEAQKSADKAEAAAAKASFGNIGDIKYTARTDVPNGGVWCDGGEYTQAQFPDVYQLLVDGKLKSTTLSDYNSKITQYKSCGFFGLDTSAKKFKVPTLTNVYIKSGQSPVLFGAESLPNITGNIGSTVDNLSNGAFAPTTQGGIVYRTGGGTYNHSFNASRSSSTYKDGAKVNPDHVVYRAYVVLYTSSAGASEAQTAEFLQAVSDVNSKFSSKSNINMDNMSAIGKNNISLQGKPDYSKGQGNITSGFVCPKNGWLNGHHEGLYNAGFRGFINGQFVLSGHRGLGYGGAYQDFMMPVTKGDVFTFDGIESDEFRQSFRFYPDRGAN